MLGGYVYFINSRETEPEAIPVPTPLPTDLQPAALFPPTVIDNLLRFEIRPSGGITDTVFIRNDDGDWVQSIPEPAQLITPTVNTQLTSLLGISSRRTLAPDTNPLDAYGLAEPSVEIIVVVEGEAGAVRRTLLIGNLVTGNGAYYVQVSGDPRVYIVNRHIDFTNIELGEFAPNCSSARSRADKRV